MKLAATIQLQQQPTPVSCTATCVAMAVGIPVRELGVDLERAYCFDRFGVWFAERSIWMRQGISCNFHGERFRNGSVYLIGALSLNTLRSTHAVLLDTRQPLQSDYERSGWYCYDPNKGRQGKKYYDWIDENEALDFVELLEHDPRFDRAGSPP